MSKFQKEIIKVHLFTVFRRFEHNMWVTIGNVHSSMRNISVKVSKCGYMYLWFFIITKFYCATCYKTYLLCTYSVIIIVFMLDRSFVLNNMSQLLALRNSSLLHVCSCICNKISRGY